MQIGVIADTHSKMRPEALEVLREKPGQEKPEQPSTKSL